MAEFTVVAKVDRFAPNAYAPSTIYNAYVVEQAPHVQKMMFGSKDYWLPMPWLYYLIVFPNDTSIYQYCSVHKVLCAPSKVTRAKSIELSKIPPMPNFTGAGASCVTGVAINPYDKTGSKWTPDTPVDKKLSDLIAHWWGSRFNSDYIYRVTEHPAVAHLREQVGWEATGASYRKLLVKWAKLSIDDVLAWNWPKEKSIYQVSGATKMLKEPLQ